MSGSSVKIEQSLVPSISYTMLALDLLERLIVVSLFVQFAWHAASNFAATSQIVSLMMIVSEALPVGFILLRRPSQLLSTRPLDWAVGVAGTMMPLLVIPSSTSSSLVPVVACLLIMIMGIYLEISAKLSLGRSFGIIAANRGVRTRGPYRFIRHPMYAGYLLTHIGILLAMPTWRTAALYSMTLTLQLWRMEREEFVLKRDADYCAFAQRVPYRLIPTLF
ncbi:MAG: isoprenylcysteine carboxylmethyltransferase family protein [Alphaproteobacteria bacterium]|nr:isoprenylcysteine carboxylmethyltransferase family protein [Alphaproteobacteria bacterium]